MKNKVQELRDYLKKVSKLTSGYLEFIVSETPIARETEKGINRLCIGIIVVENKKSRPEMIYVPLLNILERK